MRHLFETIDNWGWRGDLALLAVTFGLFLALKEWHERRKVGE